MDALKFHLELIIFIFFAKEFILVSLDSNEYLRFNNFDSSEGNKMC